MTCLNVSDPNIKALADAYGVVLAEKILRKFPNSIPSVEEARSYAESLKGSPELVKPEPDPSFKTQEEIVDEVLKRWDNIEKEFYTNEELGLIERYQTKQGEVRAKRATDATKKLFGGKRSAADIRAENEKPNNKLARETGTLFHSLMQGLVHSRLVKSTLADPVVHPDYKEVTKKPEWVSNEAYSALVKGADQIVKQIEERQTKLNRQTGNNNKAKIFLEAVIDNKVDTAGTVDIMAVYSDGKVEIYDHKFTRPNLIKTEGPTGKPQYVETYDLADVKRKSYRLQMNEYRKILRDSYKVSNDQIVKTTILPWFVDFAKSQTEYEDGSIIQKGNPENKRIKIIQKVNKIVGIGDNIKELPSGYQLTENPILDKVLVQLYDKLEYSTEQAAKNYYSNPEISQKFSDEAHQLERTIEEVSREKNVNTILRYVNNVSDWVLNNSDSIDNEHLSQLYREISFYADIINNVSGFSRLLTDEEIQKNPELAKQISQNMFEIGEAQIKISNTKNLLEENILNYLKTIDPDITRKSVRSAFRSFEYFADIDDPIFNLADRLITQQENQVKNNVDALVEEVKEWNEKLKPVGKMNVFNKIIDKTTGNLIPKIDREFKKKVRTAEKEGDVAFLKKIHTVTKEGKERYKKELKKITDNYDIIYRDNPEMRQLKIDQWIDQNNLEKSDNAWLNRWARYKYAEVTNEEQYYSKEYKALDSLSKEFYDWYFSKNKEFDKLVPERVRGDFVANIKRDAIELLADGFDLGTPKKIWQVLKNNSVRMLQMRKGDYQYIENDFNEEDFTPPLQYMDNFEYWDAELGDFRSGFTKNEVPIEKSKDLLYNIILFGESVYRKNAMTEIKDTLDNLRTYSTYKGSYQRNVFGKIEKEKQTGEYKFENDPKSVKEFNDMLRMRVRNESVVNEDRVVQIGKKTFSQNRLINWVYNVIRNNALAVNWLPAIAGGMNGFANIFAYSRKNKVFNRKGVNNALKLAVTDREFFVTMGRYFATERENYTELQARKETKSWLRRVFSKDTLYTVYRIPEEFNSDVITASMADFYGIDPQTNKLAKLDELPEGTKSLLTLLKEGFNDGKLEEGILSEEVFNDFRRKAKSISRLTKGTNTEQDKSLAHGNIYIKGVLMFRNWIWPTGLTRFSASRYDPTLGTVEMGRARVLYRELLENGKFLHHKTVGRILHIAASSTPILGSILQNNTKGKYKVGAQTTSKSYEAFLENNPQHKGRVEIEEFEQARQAELDAMLSEIRILMSIIGVLALLSMDSDEDGERDSATNPITNLAFTLTDRFYKEMTFFYNINSFMEITKNALPLTFFVGKVSNLFTNTFDELMDNIAGEDELTVTGLSKDRTEAGHYTLRMFPGYSPIVRFWEVIKTEVDEKFE